MPLITRWRDRKAAVPARAYYLTPYEHYQEAERLSWVIDEVIQSSAKRTLSDEIALARLHLELARTEGSQPPHDRNGEHRQ
jgi:hypothetical protein